MFRRIRMSFNRKPAALVDSVRLIFTGVDADMDSTRRQNLHVEVRGDRVVIKAVEEKGRGVIAERELDVDALVNLLG